MKNIINFFLICLLVLSMQLVYSMDLPKHCSVLGLSSPNISFKVLRVAYVDKMMSAHKDSRGMNLVHLELTTAYEKLKKHIEKRDDEGVKVLGAGMRRCFADTSAKDGGDQAVEVLAQGMRRFFAVPTTSHSLSPSDVAKLERMADELLEEYNTPKSK